MDGFGHMNNARYFELIDTAIDVHLQETTGAAPDGADTIGVFAEASCRFFQEMSYPAPIDLGVAVEHVGRSTCVVQAKVLDTDGRTCASASGVMMLFRP